MGKYVFLYIEEEQGYENDAAMSPEEMQQQLQAWFDWIGAGEKAGWMVDAGNALQQDSKVVRADKSVTDGPFAESKELLGGYSIVEAADWDAAVKLTEGCPVFASGGAIEIRPVMVFD